MNRYYFLITFIVVSLFPLNTLLGQTGPAGVGNSDGSSGQPENFLWLDASSIGISDGADVVNWNDISGNGTVFSASASGNLPDYELNEVNGLPVVEFNDGNSERLNVNPFNNMASDEITTIIVFATPNNGEALVSYATSGQSNEYLLFNPGNFSTYVTGANDAGGNFNDGANTFNILSTVWDSNGGLLNHFKNSSNVNSATIANGNAIASGGSLTLGGEQDAVDGGYDAGQDFGGKIAEIIVYKKALNDAERIIIENYLSEKFNITIGSDLYSARDAAFINDVRGIGTADGSNKYSESGFSDALKIKEANNSLNGTDEYVLFAHDNTAHAENITTDLGEPEIDDRWARSWFVENSGTVSSELIFDFGNAGFSIGSATDYVLLYRPDLTSDFSRLSVNSYTVQNTDQLVVDAGNANLNSGYYTIGRGDQLIPGNIYSFQSGDWNDPETWTTDPSGSLREPLGGILPTDEDNVTILAGDVVTMDSDDNDGLNLTVNEKLVIGNTSGHDFSNIAGGGTISIAGDASNNDNFPTGSTGLFADSIVGGTVEIVGSAINLNQDRVYNNLVLDLNNPSDVATLTANYTLFGTITLKTGEFSINDNSATSNLEINSYGDVLVESNASFTTGTANARHQFNFYGDLNVTGSLAFTNRTTPNYGTEANDGIVDANFLNSNSHQTIDCNGTSNFYRIEIDKGNDQTYILDINASAASNFNLYGPADYNHGSVEQLTNNDNALGLLRGTVRLNNNVDVPVLNNGGNYNISEGARLWVNGGSADKPSGTAIVPYGTIQLSDGTIDAPINSGITTRVNGNIVVSGGIMTINQIRTSVNGPENIGGYTQSGGTVNVTGNNISTDYYAFSLTYPGNTFNMSGGTLRVAGAPSGANTGGIFIASDPGNQSITGGTVIMEIDRNDDFKLASKASFWNVIMRKTAGSGTEVDLITGASGSGGNETNIVNPDLTVFNNLTIENGVTFDHNGNDVTIGSDFTIEAGADYVYAGGKRNTTSFIGTDNATITFLNRTGGTGDEQRFWNVLVDRPSGKTLSFESGKSNRNGNNNNLFRIDGDFFKVLSGTVDQGTHSIRMYADTLLNYDQICVFDPLVTDDADPNGENDILKLRDDGGPATTLITADTSRFGAIKLNSADEIIDLISDLKIDYLEYRHGRMNLDVHNLTVDVLNVRLTNQADGPDGSGEFSVEDMFITAGNSSDGGLSLKINSDGTNPGFINNNSANTNSNPTVFFFPLGTGTTGDDATSEYTPANIRLESATDDGYMTVIPVTKKLATAGPYPLGNDISDRYWIVDYRDFTTVPKVERMWFRSVEKDDPNGGADGFPGNYVPGYVLEDNPFTRVDEINGADNSTSFIDNTNATNIRIFFWGNEGSGNPSGGFDLVNAAYTAGDASKFVGQPEIFYTRLSDGSSWYNRYWQDNNNWSFVEHDGATDNSSRPAAGDFPKAGDIAVIGYGGFDGSGTVRHSINVNNGNTVNSAKVIYENPFNNNNRLVLRDNANISFDVISGTGGTFMQRYDVGDNQSITGDFGSFYSNENFTYAYYLDNNGTFNITPPTNTFPNLRVEGGNNNRIAIFQEDITINNDFIVDGNTTLRTNNGADGDIIVKEDLRIGGYLGGNFIFNDGQERTVEVGRLRFIGSAGNSNMTVDNSTNNGLRHRLIVNDDIIQERPGDFDLSGGAGINDNNVILEFAGEGVNSYSKTNGNTAEFYQIVMNKEEGLSSSFTIEENFNLTTASSTFSPLEINEGMLILDNNNIDITVLDGDLDLSIPSRAGLNITQGIVRIGGDNSGVLLDGSLIIDGGTLDMDDAAGNGNNFIEYSASGNAILEISAGALTVGAQIRPITTASTGILKYRQTGGDVRIGTQAGPEGNRGMLQVYNVGSEFIFTGGSLTIERHQSTPTIAALYLDPDVDNVTQTINIFNSSTPAGQNDFGINATIPLAGLDINGTNNPTAYLDINPLTIDGDLLIENGATLNGNGITLSLNGDFENNGDYDAQGNETIFSTAISQELLGTGTNNFFRFTKTGSGNLNLNNGIEINDLFTISAGNLNDNGNTITLRADAVIDGEHSSSGGNGLLFAGTSNQELRRAFSGYGELGVVTIENSNGVTIPDGNGYNFNINGGLRLDGGVFAIGGANILFGQSADITPVQAFSVSNMIKTNSSFADKGVGKTFAAGTTTDFTFPLGQTYYTPIVLDLSSGGNSSGSSVGTIFVSPANEFHPTVNDGDDTFGSGDVNNVLQYYWTLTASNINNFSSNVTFGYDNNLVLTNEGGFDESDYIGARILAFDNPTNEINKFTTTDVDDSNNLISFNFTGENTNGISGDYFAGIDQAIPDNVVTYVVQNSTTGDIKFSSTYTTSLPTDGIPPSGAVIEIPAGSTLQLPDNNIRLYKTIINDGATLEVINSTNHRLGILEGTGNLKITSDGINATLPAFSGNFLSCSGGGLEYAGTGSYSVLGGISSLRNLTLSGSGDRNFPSNNVIICEDLVVNGPMTNLISNRRLTVQNDLIVNNGNITTGSGVSSRVFIDGDLLVNGGQFNGSSGGGIGVLGSIIIDGGTFNMGTGSIFIVLRENFNLISGNVNSQNSRLVLNSDSFEQNIIGDLTGSNALYNVEINNRTGTQNFVLQGDLEVNSTLTLIDGKILSNGNEVRLGSFATVSPAQGRSNSYITGKVTKPLNSVGDDFTFPIGSTERWRPATVNNVSTGGLTWEAQFFQNDVIDNTIVTNLDPSDAAIETLQQGEYWVISDGNGAPSGVTAEVGLSWGIETDVSSSSSERQQLRAMVWNDGAQSWDNLGGSNFSSGNSQSQGSLVSTSAASFSENIFVMGSTDAANPLPVEMVFFKAENEGNRVQLNWQTASEKNNDFFEVQRSFDGKEFESLGIVEGAGNSKEAIDYIFNDYSPLSGDSYYRLRQVDYDGAFEYSEVVRINRQQVSDLIAVPNPTQSQNIKLRLSGFHAEQKIEVVIFDMQGRKHYQAIHSPVDFNKPLPIKQNLNSGIYVVDVKQGNIRKKVRLMIR